MKNRVLLIAQNFYPEIGSAANRMKNIYELLNENGYEVTVLTTEASYPNKNLYKDQNFWDDATLNSDSNIHRVSVRKRKYALNMLNRLLFYLEFTLKMIFFVIFNKKRFDIIYVSSPPIFIGIAGLVAKIRYRSKMVLDIRDLWPESLKGVGVFNYRPIIWFFTQLEKILYKGSNAIVVNSPRFQEHIQRLVKIHSEQIVYLPNAAREYEIKDMNLVNDNNFKVIYTGNIGLAQDVDFLKSLSSELNKENISLTIVGYGMKQEELNQFVLENELNNISFISPTTRQECLALNRQHDVGILTLKREEVFDTVLPGKLIDYMTSGLPIIASVSGFSKQLIEQYEVGFITDTADAKEVVKYVLHLKSNPNIRREMQANSKRLVRENFYWERNISKLLYLLGRIESLSNNIEFSSNKEKTNE